MFTSIYDTILLISTFIFAAVGTGGAYVLLRRLQVMDVPNERSNHSLPTPRGGGLGIAFAGVCFLMVVDAPGDLIWAFLILAAVSFRDDLRPLPVRFRLLVQLVVVAWLLLTTYEGGALAAWLPYWAELLLMGVAWLWFINLFNFMDGSDGLAASEAACISAGLLVLGALIALPPHAFIYALVVLGASLGFLIWNWHPAKVFMGDVGSVPLGFLLGFMLISLAGAGYWASALILPAVFIADASLTLLRRLLKRERIFEAHSSHAYQRAIRRGMPHDEVARHVIAVNIVLVILATSNTLDMNVWWRLGHVIVAYLLVGGLLIHFASFRHGSRPKPVTEAEVVEEIPAPAARSLPPASDTQGTA